jgi:glycosyltransferase involved in cell wall biosynthesis
MDSLALLILTCNEEENIISVIENAKKCTDEVIIIDSGSTDRTVELAESHGAKVVFRAWTNDFSAQRNFALEQTKADWVLYLDADERMNEELIADIKRVISCGDRKHHFSLLRKTVAFGKKFSHGALKPDHATRMFPRDQVKWVNAVHEHPECSLPLKVLHGHVEHYTYKNWQHWGNKMCQYSTLWSKDAYRRGKRTTLGGVFAHSLGAFLKMFLLEAGFLDGWLGVYTCFNYVFYVRCKYLKLYEIQMAEKK